MSISDISEYEQIRLHNCGNKTTSIKCRYIKNNMKKRKVVPKKYVVAISNGKSYVSSYAHWLFG